MKEILGFKVNRVNDDNVCPNCGHELNIPVAVCETKGMLGLSYEKYYLYTCSKCGLQWRIR